MDVAGEQQLDVEHNLFKQRLDIDLKPVTNEAEKHGKHWTGQSGVSVVLLPQVPVSKHPEQWCCPG